MSTSWIVSNLSIFRRRDFWGPIQATNGGGTKLASAYDREESSRLPCDDFTEIESQFQEKSAYGGVEGRFGACYICMEHLQMRRFGRSGVIALLFLVEEKNGVDPWNLGHHEERWGRRGGRRPSWNRWRRSGRRFAPRRLQRCGRLGPRRRPIGSLVMRRRCSAPFLGRRWRCSTSSTMGIPRAK